MSEVTVFVDGKAYRVPSGWTALSAIAHAQGGGNPVCRSSVLGESRGPVCGMGVCFECRAEIDGQPHVRTCQLPVREGMDIVARASCSRSPACGFVAFPSSCSSAGKMPAPLWGVSSYGTMNLIRATAAL